jgi:2-polyprenyl-3-methyl-5-hydroxy-6-metoxy-1,4-benzoquinol methylase
VTQTPEKGLEHWSRIASEWIAWARTPNHDAFWAYRDAFAAFVGRGEGEALEVGCGEGRVSRELKRWGYCVTAVDTVRELLDAAAAADSAHAYVHGAAASCPLQMAASILSSPTTC